MSEPKQMPTTQPNNIGQVTGKLGTYHKAPAADKNYSAAQKGKGDALNQHGFNKKQGV